MFINNNLLKALLVLALIGGFYLTFNPYQVKSYDCQKLKANTKANLVVSYYAHPNISPSFSLNSVEVAFKNKIFSSEDCTHASNIVCASGVGSDKRESLDFSNVSKELKHGWVEYESGKYVFDKTQVIKSDREDKYICKLK
jgi:hypothetical protein